MNPILWVVPLVAAGTVVGIGFYTVKIVGKLEEWKDGHLARWQGSIEERVHSLETSDAIRRDREGR